MRRTRVRAPSLRRRASALALVLSLGCARAPTLTLLEPPSRATRTCATHAAPDAGAPADVPPAAAASQRAALALDELRVRAQGAAAMQAPRGDRASIERALNLAWTDVRALGAAADAFAADAPPEQRAVALALAGAAFEHLAELELHAHEGFELSAEQRVACDRMNEQAARIEQQARHTHSRHEARRLIERAQAIRASATTLAQASAAQMHERHAATARSAQVEAMIRYGRAVWVADQAHTGRGVEEIGAAFARLTDAATQDVVTEALRQQTEFAYTPGMFLAMRARWQMGY